MAEGGLACTVRTPPGIRSDRGVTRDIDYDCAAPDSCRGRKCTKESLAQSERTQQVPRQRLLQFLALRVGKQGKWRRSQDRCVINERVEAPEIAGHLQRDRVNVLLAPDITDDSVGTRFICDSLNGPGGTSEKCDVRAAGGELTNQGQPQTGRPTCDGDA